MTFHPQHIGLYFGQTQIDEANKQRETDANLQDAWQWLLASPGEVVCEIKPLKKQDEPQIVYKPQLSAMDAAIAAAFRYCFDDDEASGQQAAQALTDTLQDKNTLLATIMDTLAAAHLFEMMRPLTDEAWCQPFAQYTDTLLQANHPTYVEQVWLMTLGMVAGIVLEDEARVGQATQRFQQIVMEDIHPEGFVRPAVEKVKSDSFRRMTLTVAALSLAAEAATQAGVDLWAYEHREVSVNTAATYLVYYYFYPEKWRWEDAGLSEEKTQAIFRQYGAFIEMLTYRTHPRGVELLLEQQRPFFSAAVGGLTTLSHSKTQKRKRRWFGF